MIADEKGQRKRNDNIAAVWKETKYDNQEEHDADKEIDMDDEELGGVSALSFQKRKPPIRRFSQYQPNIKGNQQGNQASAPM